MWTSKRPRVPPAEFEARVASAACTGDRTLGGIAARDPVHAEQVRGWKQQKLDGAAVFSRTYRRPSRLLLRRERGEFGLDPVGEFRPRLPIPSLIR